MDYLEDSYKTDLGGKEFGYNGNLFIYCRKCKEYCDYYDALKSIQKPEKGIENQVNDIN